MLCALLLVREEGGGGLFFTFVALLAMMAGSPAKGLSPGGGATLLVPADENLSLWPPPISPLLPKNEDDLFPLPPNREKCEFCCCCCILPQLH